MSDKQYGIGYDLLAKMGYKAGQGLGKNNQGIKECIDVLKEQQNSQDGIGKETALLRQNNQEIETIVISDDESCAEIDNIKKELLEMGVKPDIIETLTKMGLPKLKQFHQSRLNKRNNKQ